MTGQWDSTHPDDSPWHSTNENEGQHHSGSSRYRGRQPPPDFSGSRQHVRVLL